MQFTAGEKRTIGTRLVIGSGAHQPIRLITKARDFPTECVPVERGGACCIIDGKLKVHDLRHRFLQTNGYRRAVEKRAILGGALSNAEQRGDAHDARSGVILRGRIGRYGSRRIPRFVEGSEEMLDARAF